MPPVITQELAAIAAHVADMSAEQRRAKRDEIIGEIALLEAGIARRQRDFPMHAHDFGIQSDQRRCQERRREVDYLNALLAQAEPGAARSVSSDHQP